MRVVLSNHPKINTLRSYCEDKAQSLIERLECGNSPNEVLIHHANARNLSEEDFFSSTCNLVEDQSTPTLINKGKINDESIVKEIIELDPDLLCCYGSSIIKSELIRAFEGRFLNLHLGLSPYYRGSGTNYFPLVNREPQYVGATFMHLDGGIDTGRIIHQIQARMHAGDNVHQIGNRLISDASLIYANLIARFDEIVLQEQPFAPEPKLYFRKHFTENSLETLNMNFQSGMIEDYLERSLSSNEITVNLCKQGFLT